jgi:hypothetical protein
MRDGRWHYRCPRCGKPVSVDFSRIKDCARSVLREQVCRWLPQGRREGCDWVALNPTRYDRHLGSFRVNLRTGLWADFATGDAPAMLVFAASGGAKCPSACREQTI